MNTPAFNTPTVNVPTVLDLINKIRQYMTQVELAEYIGVTPRAVTRWKKRGAPMIVENALRRLLTELEK